MNKIEFIFNSCKILNNYQHFSSLGIVYYPVKANSNYFVLEKINKIFKKENKYLISTLEHFRNLKKIKIKSSQIMTMNILFSEDDFEYLYKNNVRSFTLGDIKQAIYFYKKYNIQDCNFLLRINLSEFDNTYISNLGDSITNIKKSLLLLKNSRNIGISFYISSEFKKQSKKGIIDIIKEIQIKIPEIKMISLGGISYLTKNEEIFIKNTEGDIILEPGYGLLKNSIDVKIPIIRNNCINNNYTVTLANGIYSGFLDKIIYKKNFTLYYKYEDILYNMKNKFDNSKKVTVFGGSGDSSDIIGTYYINKNIFYSVNSIFVKDVGSYFESFIMNYGNNINVIYMEEFYEIQNI